MSQYCRQCGCLLIGDVPIGAYYDTKTCSWWCSTCAEDGQYATRMIYVCEDALNGQIC